MRFMNAYVETQIPVMRTFLRDISSLPRVSDRRCGGVDDFLASPVASSIDCGYELASLQNICQELFATSSSSSAANGNGRSVSTTLNLDQNGLPTLVDAHWASPLARWVHHH